jgi:hypothetical protein
VTRIPALNHFIKQVLDNCSARNSPIVEQSGVAALTKHLLFNKL